MNISGLTKNPRFWEENQDLLKSDGGTRSRCISAFLLGLKIETFRFSTLEILDKNLSHASIALLNNLQLNEQVATVHALFCKAARNLPAPLEITFDLSGPDHNRSILDDFITAINSEHTAITTKTLFRGANVDRNHCFQATQNEILPDKLGRYKIYGKGAFLVFLPSKHSLKTFDLNPVGLRRLSLEQAWTQITEKPTLQGFKDLFSQEPKRGKLIHLSGHGSVGNPAGLNTKDYYNFLKWANTNRCQGLMLSSCYTGGKNTLFHSPSHEFKGASFPVLVGDIITKNYVSYESGSSQFFFIMRDPPPTIPELRKAVKKMDNSILKKGPYSRLQILFPTPSDSPGGFRLVGEKEDALTLTYTSYRSHQIEHGSIDVANESYLFLYPIYVECPIKLGRALLLSMVPGTAYHLLYKVSIDRDLLSFLQKSCKLHHVEGQDGLKTIFIATIETNTDRFTQLFLNLNSGECGFRSQDVYFLRKSGAAGAFDQMSFQEVSLLRFMLRFCLPIIQAAASEEAVRSATGGQQSIEEVEDHLAEKTFWGDHLDEWNRMCRILDPRISKNRVFELIEEWELSKEEVASLIHYFLINKNEALACDLFENAGLPADAKGEFGIPLLIAAAETNCTAFIAILIAKGVNLNVSAPDDSRNCLTIALDNKYEDLLNLLLEQNSLNVKAPGPRGAPSFSHAINHKENLHSLLNKYFYLNLNIFSDNSSAQLSLLAAAVENCAPQETLELLLYLNANPDGAPGNYSPLSVSVIQGTPDPIPLLLDYGANPFKDESMGHYPITEAIERSPMSLVESWFALYDNNTGEMKPNHKNVLLTNVLISAIYSGEEAKIRLALTKNPTIPAELFPIDTKKLKAGFTRLFLFGKEKLIKEIRTKFGANCPEILNILNHLIPAFLQIDAEALLAILDDTWDLTEVAKAGYLSKKRNYEET